MKLKIAYATPYDSTDIRNWSGIPCFMSRALEDQGFQVRHLGPLKKHHRFLLKGKQQAYRFLRGKTYLQDRSPLLLKGYASQILAKLKADPADIVFSPGTYSLAYLECKQPIVLWTDATFAGMVDFYAEFSNLAPETIREGHVAEQNAIARSKLAMYSSNWAARSAIEYYKADPSKVKVLPFGANIQGERTIEDIRCLVKAKDRNPCQLLFLGVDWERKGGPLALEIVKKLNEVGIAAKLKIVGCHPGGVESLPHYVEVVGFIPKSTQEGQRKINALLAESHFLVLSSRAECTPIAFCEANSFGLPCLTTDVGGIPSIISDGINGKIFTVAAGPSEYVQFIASVLERPQAYMELALSSFNEYQVRLNWKASGAKLKKLLAENL